MSGQALVAWVYKLLLLAEIQTHIKWIDLGTKNHDMTKEEVLAKTKLVGTIISMKTPAIAEIASLVGLDWIMIDMEHASLSLSDVEGLIQAVKGNCLTIVRVPESSQVWINRVLDLGCDGIMVPKINSAADARLVIKAGRYFPIGERGVGISRSNHYGIDGSERTTHLGREPLILLQIEHIEAVRNIDGILKVGGFDAIFIGPYDLSGSLGVAGKVQHASVLNAVDHIRRKCSAYDIPYGYFGVDSEALKKEESAGAKFLLVGMDALFLVKGMEEIVNAFRS